MRSLIGYCIALSLLAAACSQSDANTLTSTPCDVKVTWTRQGRSSVVQGEGTVSPASISRVRIYAQDRAGHDLGRKEVDVGPGGTFTVAFDEPNNYGSLKIHTLCDAHGEYPGDLERMRQAK